jgi:hypothetical protein
MAVRVKREMINPLYSPPPKEVRNSGSSGRIMLKLPKKKYELRHNNQNWAE